MLLVHDGTFRAWRVARGCADACFLSRTGVSGCKRGVGVFSDSWIHPSVESPRVKDMYRRGARLTYRSLSSASVCVGVVQQCRQDDPQRGPVAVAGERTCKLAHYISSRIEKIYFHVHDMLDRHGFIEVDLQRLRRHFQPPVSVQSAPQSVAGLHLPALTRVFPPLCPTLSGGDGGAVGDARPDPQGRGVAVHGPVSRLYQGPLHVTPRRPRRHPRPTTRTFFHPSS